MNDGTKPAHAKFDRAAGVSAADARPRSETATLLFAASAAVALGVACGIWLNSSMASAALAVRVAPSRLAPAAAEPRPVERRDATPPADEAEPLHASVETAEAEGTELDVTTDGRRAPRRDDADATHAAREASPRAKADVRRGVAPELERRTRSERGEGRALPCALYASAGALTLRGGGAAPLVVGGPGESGRVALTTPDWSDIAVLYEGRTGNGWVRYTVRSVSGRAGVYAVRFAAPCGSKTIPVTVTRP